MSKGEVVVKELSEEGKVEAKKLQDYFSKPETQAIVGELVVQFQGIFGFQWFTMDDVISVFKNASVEQLTDIIKTLDLCGFFDCKRQERRDFGKIPIVSKCNSKSS